MEYYTLSAERNSFIQDASYYNQGYYQMPPYTPSNGSPYSSDGQPSPSYYSSYPSQTPVYSGILHTPFHPPEYPMQYTPNNIPEIHAPIPISPYSTLIPPPASGTSHAPPSHVNTDSGNAAHPQSQSAANLATNVDQTTPLTRYMTAPQVTFPTPCDLLSDLSTKEQDASRGSETPDISSSKSKSKTVKAPKSDSEKPVAENQRKAYFRGVSENVGFKLTDPDTITSHDKKRHNLECLERYVLWLHDQIRIVDRVPVAMERFTTPNGLSSSSIRTLLLHMQIQIRKLHDEVEEERQVSTALREIMTANRIPIDGADLRRHSIASGMIPALSNTMPL